ncbi:MAG: radical SAM protein, partial [Planctomycetales bacterium]|nr:radical SAM protein [Planctomycetales bacterium]
TYSGGEPMAQARELAILSASLRQANLSIVCYTGYTIEALRLRTDPWTQRLLACVDVLIDGPYRADQAAGLRWRGSRNQRVHYLTSRYRPDQNFTKTASPAQSVADEYRVELAVGESDVVASGIWPEGFWERLSEKLKK